MSTEIGDECKEQTNQQTNIIVKKAKELNKDIYLAVKKEEETNHNRNKTTDV